MTDHRIKRSASVLLLATLLLSAPLFDALPNERKPTIWNMASAFPGSAPQFGTQARSFAAKVGRLSGGTFRIAFVEPNVLARPSKLFEAVARDRIAAAWTTSAYWFEKDPAFALFASVPFGPDAPTLATWISHGGGRELRDELYEPHGLVSITCGVMAPESGGWFRRRIGSVADFDGLKMRVFGLGAETLKKFGVEPQLVAPDRLVGALRRGEIDAAEFSMPAIDLKVGLHEAGARYYYFPGWHQQSTLFELLVSRDRWEALPMAHKSQIRIACGDTIREGLAEGESLQTKAILKLKAKGVEFHRFPPKVLARLRKAWHEVAAKLSAKSRNFERIWSVLTRFREEHRVWRELGYLDE